ncbi:MAG: substrate-binding domain-containing protein [Treponema sp.]|jgi:inositol transport system substrate-binding protein|nr:substrate-binding domain-containing protein [Treponema sp.]
MKKTLCVLVVVLLASTALFAAGKKDAGSGKILIGFARSESNDTWLSYLHDAFAAQFKDSTEYEVIWSDGQNDVTRQQDNVNAMISQGVKALAIVPVDTSAMVPITKACQDAGVILVYVNRNPFVGTQPPAGVYYCGSDSIIAGQLQMEELAKLMGGEGELCILMGQLNQEAAQDRTRGVKETIAKKFPKIKILNEATGNWMRNEGVNVTENWLTAYPNLKAIASNNDEMAMGALVAIESSGRKGIIVGGTDGNPDALQAIRDGRLACTVFQDAKGQGAGAADYLRRALKGEKLQPINWIPYVLINKDNLSQYL